MIKIVLLSLFAAMSSILLGQPVLLRGKVLGNDNKPINCASIKFRANDSTGLIRYFKIADEDGSFSISIPNANQQLWLQISATGYVSYNEKLPQPIIFFKKEFSLKIFTGQLPTVHVKGNSNITRHGDTTMYKVAAFERGNENSLADLLKNLPGISVTDDGKVVFNGQMIDKVLLEGDDLFGSNYSTLTKNTGTNGLERIDVIENYTDKSRIETSLSKGNETVINLRYKQKKIKLFGNINGAGGLPLKNYELKTDWISLIPKTKFVITTNNNSLGTTANYLLGRENQLNAINNDDDRPVAYAASASNPVQFGDVVPLNMNAARTLLNTSKFATINTQIKLGKKLTVKAFAILLADDYSQTNSNTQVINNPQQPLTISETNQLLKNNKQADGGAEINWVPSNKFQSIFKYRFSSIDANYAKNGFLFSLPVQQHLLQNINQQQLQITTTKLFTGRRFITSQLLYSSNTLSSGYTIKAPLYDTSFRYLGNYQNLYQPIDAPAKTLAAMVRFYSGMYQKSLAFQLSAINNKYELNHAAFVYNKKESLLALPETYANSLTYTINKINLNTVLSYVIGEKIETGIEGLAQWIQLKNNQLLKNTFIEKKKFFFLPSFNFKYKFNNKKSLYTSLQTMAILPYYSQLNQASLFTGLVSVTNGINELKMGTGFSANLSYHSFDPIVAGTIFSTYISFSNNPINYLQNLSNRRLYSFTVAELFNKNSQFLNWGTRLEKNMGKSKSWLIASANISLSNMYSYVNNQLNSNLGTGVKTELRWKTLWDKWFNINTGLIYNYQVQNSYQLGNRMKSFAANALTSNTVINLKFFNKLSIDLLADYLLNKPNGSFSKQIIFADAQITYPINKSIKIGAIARNIFNQKSFVVNEINAYQNTSNQFDLQPTFYLLTLGIRF